MNISLKVFTGEGKGKNGVGGNVQGIRSIIGRHKVERERLRMIWETEKSKNLYVQAMNMN